jgi:hypothetical protein
MGLRPVPGNNFELQIPLILAVLVAVFVKNAGYHECLALAAFAWSVVYGVLYSASIG